MRKLKSKLGLPGSVVGLKCVTLPDHALARNAALPMKMLADSEYIAHSRYLPVGALTAQPLREQGHSFRTAIKVVQFSSASGNRECREACGHPRQLNC
jgi:hypothetical protein